MKTTQQGLGELADWWANRLMCQAGDIPWLHRERAWKLRIRDPPRSCPVCILHNRTVIVSIALSWVLWVILVNYWTWVGHGNPWTCRRRVRSLGGWHLKWGQSYGSWALKPMESYAKSGWLVFELNCSALLNYTQVPFGVETEHSPCQELRSINYVYMSEVIGDFGMLWDAIMIGHPQIPHPAIGIPPGKSPREKDTYTRNHGKQNCTFWLAGLASITPDSRLSGRIS